MKPKREEPIIHATLEVLDEADDVRVERGNVKLTEAEIQEREAEKARLTAELRSRVAAAREAVGNIEANEDIPHLDPRARRAGSRREPAAVAEPSATQPATTPTLSRALEAATTAVEHAEDELAALERERRNIELQRADAQRAEEEQHQARRAALRQRINAAEAEAKKQRLAHAATRLAEQVKAAELEQARDRQRRQASIDEKNAHLAARVMPVIERARATYAALQKIQREHGANLEKLSSMSWDKTPETWPGSVRVAWNGEVHDLAIKRQRELNLMIVGLEQNLRTSVALVAGGWRADASFPATVNEAIRLLSYSDEYVRVAEEGLAELHAKLADIFERAAYDPRATPDLIEVMPAHLRQAAKAEALARMAERAQQAKAE